MSRAQLAETVGYSVEWLKSVEFGRRKLDRHSVIVALADALEVHVVALLRVVPHLGSAQAMRSAACSTGSSAGSRRTARPGDRTARSPAGQARQPVRLVHHIRPSEARRRLIRPREGASSSATAARRTAAAMASGASRAPISATARGRSWQGAIGSPVESMNQGTPPTPALARMLSPIVGRLDESTCSRSGAWS
ncbi:XRE family transcriptional regulator [Actinomadura rubrisoli]|uniref:XRE family transcriptional regulator n=1 Tax=Actinomadura rubrisoli TaxID=2530368 RepID=A0A4R5A310_9ACTN|nr:XRE family transcriptional regulator [Actinomadura rubrisoli]